MTAHLPQGAQPTPGVYNAEQAETSFRNVETDFRWQPIANAPDHTLCLVCDSQGEKPFTIAAALQDDGLWFYDGEADEQIDFEPEFWMPSLGGRRNPFHEPLPVTA